MKYLFLFLAAFLPLSAQQSLVNGKGGGITDRQAFKVALRADQVLDIRDYGAIANDGLSDVTAVAAAFTAASASTTTRTVYFPPGIWKCQNTIPINVQVLGAGISLDGDNPPLQTVTVVTPNVNGSPVFLISTLHGQKISDLDIYGNGAGTSNSGIAVENGGSYPGMGLHVERVRITAFTDGIRLNSPNACTFIEVSVNYCNYGWRGINLSDTWQLINCHGNFCNTAAISVATPRTVTIQGGDWGNTSAPLLLAGGGGNVIWEGTNIESVNNARIFETSNTSLVIRDNRVAFNGLTTAALVRQTTYNANVTLSGNNHDGAANFGTYGAPLAWETNDVNSPAPTFVGQGGVARLTDAGFTTTTRAWRPGFIGVFAYRNAIQTFPTGADARIVFTGEAYDHSQSFVHTTGIFTAPEAGYYTMTVSVILNTANAAGYSRVREWPNGAAAGIIQTRQNAPQYEGLGGSLTRYLAAGDTWGAGFLHNKGSDMDLYATGSLTECVLTITKVSR